MLLKQLYIPVLVAVTFLCSCSSRMNISTKYYQKHEVVLDSIESAYKSLTRQKSFSLQFINKKFDEVSIDIITDSIKYVYAFRVEEKRFKDTLKKYGYNANGVSGLIRQMQSVRCTWINNFSYNSDQGMQSLVFMSIRQVSVNLPFVPPKYYILTWFSKPQYFDSEGRLLTGRRLKKLVKINGDVFRRINDKVCYSISSTFR